ncbi:MAG: YceI family protein [Brevirhabdus sp.]
MIRTLRLLALTFALVAALPVWAAPARYVLDADRSSVRFFWDVNGAPSRGAMDVAAADLVLDLRQVSRSRVTVEIDVGSATARLPFAQQAIRGPEILHAARHPRARFESTSVRREGDGARIDGLLTLRGVTRPVTLRADIYRQQGSQPGDLSALTIRLTGAISRAEFGATGFARLVGDTVRLDILARIERAGK